MKRITLIKVLLSVFFTWIGFFSWTMQATAQENNAKAAKVADVDKNGNIILFDEQGKVTKKVFAKEIHSRQLSKEDLNSVREFRQQTGPSLAARVDQDGTVKVFDVDGHIIKVIKKSN